MSNLTNLIDAFSNQGQDIENAFAELYGKRNLFLAEGDALDMLGAGLDLIREIGDDDSTYRAKIIFRIFLNMSSGTPEELLYATKVFTSAVRVWLLESINGSVLLQYTGESCFQLFAKLNAIRCVGVSLRLSWSPDQNILVFGGFPSETEQEFFGEPFEEYDFMYHLGGSISENLNR